MMLYGLVATGILLAIVIGFAYILLMDKTGK
jgi:hypothetical protein